MKRSLAMLLVLLSVAVGLPAPVVETVPVKRVERIHLPASELDVSRVFTPAEVTEAAVDWGIATLQVPAAWKVTNGEGVVVAVLDSGCDSDHRDLNSQILVSADFTGEGTGDKLGHGTHVAGIIAAAKNGWGMVGVAPGSRLLVGKVIDKSGSGELKWIADGIRWAIAKKADVINLSLGGPGAEDIMQPAIREAVKAGILVIVAAGNSGPGQNSVDYPGAYPESIAIGAVDSNMQVPTFSSRGPQVYVAAPGVKVRSCYPGPGNGLFATLSGTSMATPHATGLAALWVAANPGIDKVKRPAAFRQALRDAAIDLAPAGRDTASGYGLPNAELLVANGKPLIKLFGHLVR